MKRGMIWMGMVQLGLVIFFIFANDFDKEASSN